MVPDTEAPARLAITLKQLLCAVRSLGLDEATARDVVRKVALDSTPVIRRQAFTVLADAPSLPTRVVSETLNYPTSTAKRALEDLNAHRLVRREQGVGNQGDQWFATSEALRLWGLCRPPCDPDEEARLAMQDGA